MLFRSGIAFLLLGLSVAPTLVAQQDVNSLGLPGQMGPGLVGSFDSAASVEPATITTQFVAATTDQPAVLAITVTIAPHQHAYSLTQPPGGPQPTKIELERSTAYRLLAPFTPLPLPNARVETGEVWTGLRIEEHEGTVTWFAPIELTAGVDPKRLEIRGKIQMLVCSDGGSCIPVNERFAAMLAAEAPAGVRVADWPPASPVGHPQSSVASYEPKNSAVKWSGKLVPAVVRPGESGELRITAKVPPKGHLYALADRDAAAGTKPTLIAVETAGGLVPHRPATDATVQIDNSQPAFGPMRFHEGDVTWTQRIEVPKEAAAGEYTILGMLGYQMCDYGGGQAVCELPQSLRFSVKLQVGGERSQNDAPLTFAPGAGYPQVAAAAAMLADFYEPLPTTAGTDQIATTPVEPAKPGQPSQPSQSAKAMRPMPMGEIGAVDEYDLSKLVLQDVGRGAISYYLAIAFVGGLILNLMPCVLPVIGLKVMSFVDQAGKSRSHALVLNLWFAAGIIAVFLLLGVLAITLGLSWGGQNGKTPFNVTVAVVVFAMALSLLGVWEVPIPGFFGSGSVQSAASKEGALGAFSKGVITTVLATPCTAPFMASAIAWAVTQPAATNLLVFTTVGLGMASPYLLIGVFPELMRFLPKPGAWMDTFKQVSGFVLMGTVIFILSYIEPAAVVPTILLLLGVAVACWWVARTPLTAELADKAKAWGWGCVVTAIFGGIAYSVYLLAVAPADKAWQPFSLERLKQVAVVEGKTVLVDFSAEWCVNCKFFEKTVLHTAPVEQAIREGKVVTMYGDFTDYAPEIDRTLKSLGANGVPVIAIFPGGTPYEPIVFRGGYLQQDLVKAIVEATSRRGRAVTALQ
ncbi:MAG: thioredoxin family protein [Pirellulales bacterium]|nr:thioredoxin family protein [Pirellulales bacterium]